jgi:hypothetical protein
MCPVVGNVGYDILSSIANSELKKGISEGYSRT